MAVLGVARIPAGDVSVVFSALRAALKGDGPPVWPSATAESIPNPPLTPERLPSDTAVIVETSGSVAAPKRVLLSAGALLSSVRATHEALGGPGQWLLALPVHYIAGIQVLVRSIVAGVEPVHYSVGSFTAHGFAASVGRMTAVRRYVSLIPAQLARLVAAGEKPAVAEAVRRCDALVVGGQALDPGLLRRARDLGFPVVRSFGATETAGGCVYDGVPIGDVRVRIVAGEIQIAGAVLASGYLNDAERTASAFTVDDGVRWYRTGDLGSADADGRLIVTGRADDLIVSGGVKVALGEVERTVRAVPGFEAALVVAVPSAWGSSVAVVALSTPVAAGEDALARLVRACVPLGPAARPVALKLVEVIPELRSGKPDRAALGALFTGSEHS